MAVAIPSGIFLPFLSFLLYIHNFFYSFSLFFLHSPYHLTKTNSLTDKKIFSINRRENFGGPLPCKLPADRKNQHFYFSFPPSFSCFFFNNWFHLVPDWRIIPQMKIYQVIFLSYRLIPFCLLRMLECRLVFLTICYYYYLPRVFSPHLFPFYPPPPISHDSHVWFSLWMNAEEMDPLPSPFVPLEFGYC